MRARLPVLLALPLLLGPGLLACLNGGYFDGPRLWAAIVAWALLAVVAVALPRPLPASGPGRAGARRASPALTAWTAISLSWAPDGGAAVDDVQRLLLYLPYLALAIAVLGPLDRAAAAGRDHRRVPVRPVRALRARRGRPRRTWRPRATGSPTRSATGTAPAPSPRSGSILAAALAGDAGRPARLRAAAAAAAPPLALTVLLTFSRGALGALGAGVLLLLAIAPSRGRLAAAALVVGGGMAARGSPRRGGRRPADGRRRGRHDGRRRARRAAGGDGRLLARRSRARARAGTRRRRGCGRRRSPP